MDATSRLTSIDVFRGLTIAVMILVNYPGSYENTYSFLEHSHWNGIAPADFIFPFFIFIVGVSIALSYSKQISAGISKKKIVRKIFIRTIKIYLIGLFLHYLPDLDFSRIDLFGVLQRISIVFLACSLLFIYTNWKTQLYIFAGILLAYWIALSFIPTGQYPAGTMEPGNNFAAWFDRLFFSAEMMGKHGWNSEGLFSTFPAIASGISGMLAGRRLISGKTDENKLLGIVAVGFLCIVAGAIWDWQFPINKKIWTSSYVLYTSGWAAITMALSVWLIDLKNYKNNFVARIGVIFGTNAIAVYVMADVFQTFYQYSNIHDFVYLSLIGFGTTAQFASMIWALISVGSCFLFGYLLYLRKIFIKL